MNTLYYGDCLTIMQQEMKQNSVDLIYLDPPFNSNRNYHSIYKDETGRPLPSQIEAFCDMWTLNEESERAIRNMPVLMREAGIEDKTVEFWRLWMNALRGTQPRLLAYLSYMVQRLVVMKGLLRPTGSIYLHSDPTASHYIKVMMDGIFGHDEFLNEIIWRRTGAHGRAKKWGPIHDVLLFYSKSKSYKWNKAYQPYDPDYLEKHYKNEDEYGKFQPISLTGPGVRSGSSGLPWRDVDPNHSGRHWGLPPDRALPQRFVFPNGYSHMDCQERLDVLDRQGMIYWPPHGSIPRFKRYIEVAEGNPVQDVIWDIRPISSHASERLGYATQKPLALLERIIKSSTDKGDVVFDPFCGCATTIEAAHRLDRQWIGIDVAIHAIKRVATIRLKNRCKLKAGEHFEIRGVPNTLEGARDLWERDKYHFQKWAVETVDGFVTTKRTADGGIDGRLYFDAPGEKELQSMVLEVKGGKNVAIKDLRALHSVLNRDEAIMAGLIVMEPLKQQQMQNFKKLMGEAGSLDIGKKDYPCMQILSIQEILDGKQFHTPTVMGKEKKDKTGDLFT